jgi:hypothetical protein
VGIMEDLQSRVETEIPQGNFSCEVSVRHLNHSLGDSKSRLWLLDRGCMLACPPCCLFRRRIPAGSESGASACTVAIQEDSAFPKEKVVKTRRLRLEKSLRLVSEASG